MDTCDVLIVGGGPAGAACAWRLRDSSLDIVVMDRAEFPRDKLCAGWITPPVIDQLQIDVDEYRRRWTFQPITGFRIGLIGDDKVTDVSYDRPVSYGIRRCEFDTYLLRRTAARLELGTPVSSLRRDGHAWVVNERMKARMIVGAGGHTCPVARLLNPTVSRRSLVAAQEVELAFEIEERADCPIEGTAPELYFSQDLTGYGWCFRKQAHLNVGFGQLDARDLPRSSNAFSAFLKDTRRVPRDLSWDWRGHAYLIAAAPARHAMDDGLMLVGDAAGIADPRSGEGILPAIESGLMAASTILEAGGRYTRDRLQRYARQLRHRFGQRAMPATASSPISGLSIAAARLLLRQSWFVRHVVVDRWFLHRTAGV